MKKLLFFHSGRQRIIEQFLHEMHPKRLLPGLTAGCILGILNITLSTSFAVLIFSGEFSPYVSRGIGFILFGAMMISVIVALTSSLSGTIAAPQEIPAAIFALISVTLLKSLSGGEGTEHAFVTLMAVIMATSLLTGAFFLLLGALKLGNLTRFIPYSVIGGFLAGTGWLLTKGALSVMTDTPFDLAHASEFFQSSVLLKWLPGVIFGAILLVISRRYHHFLVMPMTLVAGMGLFFLLLALARIPIADAEVRGWLLGPFPSGGLWQPFTPAEFTQIQWTALNAQIGGQMGSILLFGAMSLLLNAAGLELAVRQDIELNRELVSAGLGNIFTGLSGGIVGFHTLSDTALGHRIAPNSRVAGVVSAILCGMTLAFGASLLAYFPRFLAGGLLFFLGLSFLVEWLYDAWRTLPKTDYLLVLTIVGIVGTVGFQEGVLFGMFMTIVIFVVNYSRIDVIKHRLSGVSFQSRVIRSAVDRQILQKKGDTLAIYALHGFLFFGTANAFYQQIRRSITDPAPSALRFLVLDFRFVSGLDSSAYNSFLKLKQLADIQGIRLIFTHLLPAIQQRFQTQEFCHEEEQPVQFFQDLDHGVEWCEEQILMAEEAAVNTARHAHKSGALLDSAFDDIMKSLDQQERFEAVMEELMPYLDRQDALAGEYLIRQGERPEALYFIESGQIVVQFDARDGKTTRLRTMNTGTVIGELGVYLEQQTSANVIVQQPGTMYRLSSQALQRMKSRDPHKLIHFHEFMVYLLSERLVHTTNILYRLLD